MDSTSRFSIKSAALHSIIGSSHYGSATEALAIATYSQSAEPPGTWRLGLVTFIGTAVELKRFVVGLSLVTAATVAIPSWAARPSEAWDPLPVEFPLGSWRCGC